MAEKDFSFLDDMLRRVGKNPIRRPIRIDLQSVFGSKYTPENQPLRLTVDEGKQIIDTTLGKQPANLQIGNGGYWTNNNRPMQNLKTVDDIVRQYKGMKIVKPTTGNLRVQILPQDILDFLTSKNTMEDRLAQEGLKGKDIAKDVVKKLTMPSMMSLTGNALPFLPGAYLTGTNLNRGYRLYPNNVNPNISKEDAEELAKIAKIKGYAYLTGDLGGAIAGGILGKNLRAAQAGALGGTGLAWIYDKIIDHIKRGQGYNVDAKPVTVWKGENAPQEEDGKSDSNIGGKSLSVTNLPTITDIQGNPDNMEDVIKQMVELRGLNKDLLGNGNIPNIVAGNNKPITIPNGLQNVQPEATESPVEESLGVQGILDLIAKQEANREPYRQGLKDLIDNYKQYQVDAFNRDRYLASIAGWSGNDAYKQMIGKYNPLDMEANRLDLINKLAEEYNSQLARPEQVMANARIAQSLGMSPDIALADSNLVGKLNNLAVAKLNADARRYVADVNSKARMDVAQLNANAKLVDGILDRELKAAIANGDNQRALMLQQMKNENALRTSYINNLWAFDKDPTQLVNALRMFGYNVDVPDMVPTVNNTKSGSSLSKANAKVNAQQKRVMDTVNSFEEK